MYVCACLHVHTLILHVRVYTLTYMHAELAGVCVGIYICVGRVYMFVHVYLHKCIFAYMHAESAWVCVHVYMYTL